VTPIIAMPQGRRRVHMTHDGTAPFCVTLLDINGNAVAGQHLDEYGAYDGTVTIEIALDGAHIFSIEADGNRTLNIE
jgi:hypothetical protein